MLKNETSADAIMEALCDLAEGFDIDDVIDEGTWDERYGGYNEEVRYLLFRYEVHLASSAA